MKGLRATNSASATMPVTIAPPAIVELAGPQQARCQHRRTRPNPDDHQGEEAIELAEECKTGRESREQGEQPRCQANSPGPGSVPGPQLKPERHQHERLARDVGHRPMSMESEKRIQHQQDSRDRAHAIVFDHGAASKDRDTAKHTDQDDRNPSGRQRSRRSERFVAAIPLMCVDGPRHREVT